MIALSSCLCLIGLLENLVGLLKMTIDWVTIVNPFVDLKPKGLEAPKTDTVQKNKK